MTVLLLFGACEHWMVAFEEGRIVLPQRFPMYLGYNFGLLLEGASEL